MSRESRSTRWSALWRRRRGAASAAALAALLIAGVAAYVVEPAHRASASLRIEGRSVAAGVAESAAHEDATQYAQELHRRALAGQGEGRASLRIESVAVTVAPDGRRLASVELEIFAQHVDAAAARRAVTDSVEGYVAAGNEAALLPASTPPALEEARLAAERLAAEAHASEAELEAFERANAGVLELGAAAGVTVEPIAAALARAQGERQQLERNLVDLEARRVELDRGLREMQAGNGGPRDDSVPSSEALAALQTQWAMARGRLGRDSAQARELAGRIEAMRSESERRLAAVTTELSVARAELARLERAHTIEHPDVVAQAHKLSAMESRFESSRLQGLTDAETAYIEGLARERRDIDDRIAQARARDEELVELVEAQQARAMAAPALREQHLTLEQRLQGARTNHDAARELRDSLDAELAAQRERRPGRVSLATAVQVSRSPWTQPYAILVFGAVLAVVAALVAVAAMERLDRRIAGTASLRRVQGGAARVVEIPLISPVVKTA